MDVPVEIDRLRRYLLADLPDLEEQRLEEQLLRDHELLERVRAVEDDLVDEFVRGELPEGARRQFEAAFLTSQVQRDKVALARALQTSVFTTAQAVPEPRAAFTAVRPGSILGRGWLRWGLAAATVAILALGTLLVRSERRVQPGVGPQAQAPNPTPPIPTTPPEATPGASTILAVTLTPGLLRDPAGGNRVVNIDARIQTLRLVLEIDRPSRDSRYRVTIETAERRVVWSGDAAEPVATAEPAVTADAPSSALPDGDYIVRLQAASAGASRFRDVQEYLLSVRRSPR